MFLSSRKCLSFHAIYCISIIHSSSSGRVADDWRIKKLRSSDLSSPSASHQRRIEEETSNINLITNDNECCDLADFPICFIGVAKCCSQSGQWKCPNGDTNEYACPGEEEDTTDPIRGGKCNNNYNDNDDENKCCDPSLQLLCLTGKPSCCPEGAWACPGSNSKPFSYQCPVSGNTDDKGMNGRICESETPSISDDGGETCCDPFLEPGVLANPLSFEGHRCCPNGSWGYSIGDATNFGCGKEILPYPNGKVCDICSLPADAGTCEAIFPSWFFNSDSGKCEEFSYGGCDGNANLFKSESDCKQLCPRGSCCNEGSIPRCPSGEASCCPEGEWSCPDDGGYYMCEGDRLDIPVEGPFCKKEESNILKPVEEGGDSVFGAICFSGKNAVLTQNKGQIQMKDLKIGDLVHVGEGKYSRVYSFGHHSHDSKAEYLQLKVDKRKESLEISKDHMVFMATNKAVPAFSVSIGNQLIFSDENNKMISVNVTNITKVNRVGAYAPFTESGTIMVNGLLVSNYVSLQEEPSGSFAVAGIRTVPMHWLAHSFQAPHRFFCRSSVNACSKETYTNEGISYWVSIPLIISRWFLRQHVTVVIILSIPVVCLAFALNIAELSFLFPVTFAMVYSIITLLSYLSKNRAWSIKHSK